MDKFTLEDFFAEGHKNVEGLFILLSNTDEPGVQEVLSSIKHDENVRKQFDEIIEKALPLELASVENLLIGLISSTVYKLVKQNPVVHSFELSKKITLKPIEELSDYNDNMQVIKTALVAYKTYLNSIRGTEDELKLQHFHTQESRKKYDNLQEFVNELSKFFTLAEKAQNICFERNQNFAEFSSLTTALNKKMIAALKTCSAKVAVVEDLGFGLAETGKEVFADFATELSIFNSHMINAAKKDKAFRDDVQAEIEKAKLERSKVEPTISPAEQERLAAIKKANDLYEELCLDFMRDLEKQYALSSKDMYEYFVDVKFKKFVERFHMPLSNSTSLGTANEAQAQIKNLMNYVSKISENSYTTSVYPFEKQ
ncbi:MAG: hypothetical protein IKD36_00885 [Clostridia bacterium]|nr:hypothetical protein [Clostridia bacterium]